MTTHQTSARPSPAGWLLSGLVILALLADAAVNLLAADLLAANMQAEGFPIALAPTLGIMMLLCAVIYAIPRTAMLGAILITGFFGGAICVHVRLGEIGSPPQIICVLLAAMAWGGLYLRDARIRALMPLRSSTA
ncbi:MAG: DoxX family protein [Sphingomonas sp.]|nr:DoxX family protein [Sphingomonas sp.]